MAGGLLIAAGFLGLVALATAMALWIHRAGLAGVRTWAAANALELTRIERVLFESPFGRTLPGRTSWRIRVRRPDGREQDAHVLSADPLSNEPLAQIEVRWAPEGTSLFG
jgi:hypothetical protein